MNERTIKNKILEGFDQCCWEFGGPGGRRFNSNASWKMALTPLMKYLNHTKSSQKKHDTKILPDSRIAADIKVIRATITQQPLPVKGEAPTLPNSNGK